MKILRELVASSHIDQQNMKFAISTLNSMVDQANSSYIPYGVEHDPRIPPLGRIRQARLVPLQDGEAAIEADIEIFDDLHLPSFDSTRKMALHSVETAEIGFDQSYRTRDLKGIIQQISKALGTKPREEIKKSLDPVSLIEIFGLFVISQIASGFLQKVGADAWDTIRSGLKKLAGQGPKGQLFAFHFCAKHGVKEITVEVILTDPSSKDIDQFLTASVPSLYNDLNALLDIEGLAKLVVGWEAGQLKPLYGLRSDAVPVSFGMKSPRVTSSSQPSRSTGTPLSTGPATKSTRSTTRRKEHKPRR